MILEKLRLFIATLSLTLNPFTILFLWLGLGNSKVAQTGRLKAYLRNNGIDYWIFIENLIDDTYGLKSLRFFKFDNIIDIGGNVGLFTVATKRYWPKARRLIVEPNKQSLLILKKNLKINKIKSRVLNKAVVGNKTKKHVKLFLNQNPAMSSLVSAKGKSVKVGTVCLSDIVPDKGYNLVKIDIEGGEYLFLKPSLSKIFSRISVLLMETHDIDKIRNYHAVVRFLKNAGFKVYYKDRQITAINPKRISL